MFNPDVIESALKGNKKIKKRICELRQEFQNRTDQNARWWLSYLDRQEHNTDDLARSCEELVSRFVLRNDLLHYIQSRQSQGG